VSKRKFTIGVATPTGMTAPYAYFTPAVVLGYDRDEGLEFSFFYGGEPGATASALCNGLCDIGCLNTIVGFMGRSNGLPMLAIGSKARRAHRYFAVLPDSPVKNLADLKGKKIACDFSHIQPLAEAALAEEGVPPGAFQWIPWHGSGMQIEDMIEPFCRGEADALFIMDWTDGDAVARHLTLRHIRSQLLERIRVSSCYWTTEEKFAADKDLLACGLRAIQKSLVFSFSNPEAALEAMWDVFPETRPAPSVREAVLQHDLEVLKACLEPMRIDSQDPDPRWCAIPAEEMIAWQQFLVRSGAIPKELDLKRLYTTSLVARINEFDADEVRSRARLAIR
jgi:ABC-type nitrate/sulfonate/bicarbonate transport system substrate-binding protein